ncbi:lytic transglycosylase domain-containing protein [Sulfitobacter sp. JB4-11]|uniref:lytic transglycosylase domain-containing protein n=1 Tax=Sulfitobacter rhodophyticola TaxID=3238304 RepID=UPI003515888B
MDRKIFWFAGALAVGSWIMYEPADATELVSWKGFYSLSTRPALAPDTPEHPERQNITIAQPDCIAAILAAQSRHQIPNNLLLAIGVQEAGRQVDGALTIWPWTGNYHGNGAFFRSKVALENWVRGKQAQGISSIDVGCMQVNQKWHAQEFASLEQATDPIANADYAARFLRRLYRETGDWWEAAGRYHSSRPKFKEIYLTKLTRNQQVANAMMANGIALAANDPRKASGPASGSGRPKPIIGWSADMTGAIQGRRFNQISIYSNVPLQPLLLHNAVNN